MDEIHSSLAKLLLAVRCGLPQTKCGYCWARTIAKEMYVHPVLDNGFPGSVPFEPEEPQKISMEGINVEGVEHLFYVTHHGGILSPETY